MKCSPVSAPLPPNPPHGAELWGAESLQSPTLTGPPAQRSSNAFLFLYICSKQPHFLPCGSISSTLMSLRLTKRSLVLVPHLFWSFGAVILHVSCPNSASRLGSCYSWYLLTWNCVQLEFSDNDRFNTTVLVSPSPMTRRPYVPSPTSPRPRVPVSPSPTSRRPQALASQVPHPRPTFSHSPKSELG